MKTDKCVDWHLGVRHVIEHGVDYRKDHVLAYIISNTWLVLIIIKRGFRARVDPDIVTDVEGCRVAVLDQIPDIRDIVCSGCGSFLKP